MCEKRVEVEPLVADTSHCEPVFFEVAYVRLLGSVVVNTNKIGVNIYYQH